MCFGCTSRVMRSRPVPLPGIGMESFPLAVDGHAFAKHLVLAPAIQHTTHAATKERCLERHSYLRPRVRPGVRTGPSRNRYWKLTHLSHMPALKCERAPES